MDVEIGNIEYYLREVIVTNTGLEKEFLNWNVEKIESKRSERRTCS